MFANHSVFCVDRHFLCFLVSHRSNMSGKEFSWSRNGAFLVTKKRPRRTSLMNVLAQRPMPISIETEPSFFRLHAARSPHTAPSRLRVVVSLLCTDGILGTESSARLHQSRIVSLLVFKTCVLTKTFVTTHGFAKS